MTRAAAILAVARAVALGAALGVASATAGGVTPAQHIGVASCAQSFCHGSAKPLTVTRVLQNEYLTWLNFDPHSRAYATLRSAKSQAMAQRLGIGKPTESAACLGCHADDVPAAQRGAKFQIEDGIGCEACHGSAQEWIAPHHSGGDKSHAANVARGLVPVDLPQTRAAVCASCHVGDRRHFASHSMMAAGHPRLSFELDTFTEIWRTEGGREHYRRDDDYRKAQKNADSGVAVWLRGLVQTADTRLDIIDAYGKASGVMPEFGIYNCYSCHRSMRVEGWAGSQADGLPPGSLRFDDSPMRMLIAALEGTRRPLAGELRAATRQWQLALNDRSRLTAAQQNLRRVLAAVEREIASLGTAPGQAAAMLDALVASAQRGEYPDYATAEQAAMAMVLLLDEAGSRYRRRPDVDLLFRALQDDRRFDPGVLRRIQRSDSRRVNRP